MSLILFSNRLKELMITENISRHSLALRTGLQRKSILNWLNGKYYPRYDALIKLADFFRVSINYLLCLPGSSYKECFGLNCSFAEVPTQFINKLSSFMNEKKMTKYGLAKNLNLGQTTVERWFKLGSMPETVILIKISILMKESVDYLLGRE